MPKIKRTDPAACSVPRLGHFEQGDELTVTDQVADQFRGSAGWEVRETDDERIERMMRVHSIPDALAETTTTTETPEEGEGE